MRKEGTRNQNVSELKDFFTDPRNMLCVYCAPMNIAVNYITIKKFMRFLGCACSLAIASAAPAAELGTYVLGSTGIKGATVPPPGLYAISLEFAYRATEFRDENGDRVSQINGQKFSGKAEGFLNITSITYISPYKIFGATYGARIADTAGVLSLETRIGPFTNNQKESGNADFYIEPINLSWHLPRFDLFVSYGVYAPLGEFRRNDPVPVSDRWSHLLSAGMTAYLDAKKQWALSIVPRYEIFHGNMHSDSKAGNNALFEWGLSRSFVFLNPDKKTPHTVLDVGPVGYACWKITEDEAAGVSDPNRYSVYAAGLEAGVTRPQWHMARFSLRYEKEFMTHSRPQGQLGILRLSVKF
jgi:hypothetical protein